MNVHFYVTEYIPYDFDNFLNHFRYDLHVCCAVGAYSNELILKVLVDLCLVNALFTQYSNQVALYQGCVQKI